MQYCLKVELMSVISSEVKQPIFSLRFYRRFGLTEYYHAEDRRDKRGQWPRASTNEYC